MQLQNLKMKIKGVNKIIMGEFYYVFLQSLFSALWRGKQITSSAHVPGQLPPTGEVIATVTETPSTKVLLMPFSHFPADRIEEFKQVAEWNK